MLQNCNAMKETGALIYKADRSIAEQIWQGANKLAAPNIKPAKFCSEIEIDLPAFLLESIENFGAITTKSALPNENLNYKAKITRTNGSFLLAPPTSKISSPRSPAPEFSSPKSTLAIPIPAPSEKSENKISDPTSRFSPDFSPKRSPRKLTPLPLPTPIHTEHPNPDPVLSIPIPVSPNETEPVNLAPFKIVLIGNSKVGKTCIANRFTRNSFSADYTPSAGIEFDYRKITVDVGKQRSFQIWSPTGNAKSRKELISTCKGAHGIICVYDVTNLQSLLDLAGWIDDAHTQTGTPFPPKILVGNKSDLVRGREVDSTVAKKFADKVGTTLFEISAKNSTYIDGIFLVLAAKIVETFPELKDLTA